MEGSCVTVVQKLFDEGEIAGRVEQLAGEIGAAVPPDIVVVGVLKGSFVFMADLVRALDGAGLCPRTEFIRLSSYGSGRQSSGEVQLIGEVPATVAGRAVLLIDDIADTGRSFVRASEVLRAAGATRIWTCALVDKPGRREVACDPDFIGFTVGDVFVVGYGIDYAEEYRHLPYIGSLD
jgi:hypoxanthine phosphoribosyltransferase